MNLSTHSVLWKVKRAHMDALWALGALPASRRSAGQLSFPLEESLVGLVGGKMLEEKLPGYSRFPASSGKDS